MATQYPEGFEPISQYPEGFEPIQAAPIVPRRTSFPSEGKVPLETTLKDVLESVPFYGSPSEFRAGVKSGQELFSPAVTGNTIASILDAIPYSRETLSNTYGGSLGAARALATVLNPIGKLIGSVSPAVQASASAAGGDTATAIQDILGSRPVQSAAEIPYLDTGIPFIDVPVNTNAQALNEAIIKQPAALAGLTPKALAAQGAALRNFPRNVAEVGSAASDLGRRVTSPLRSSAPVDPVAVESALKRVQDLEFQREQNRINTSKTAEARNAQDLILQEELALAQQEATSLGQEALQANIEIGPQIEGLIRSSQEAAGQAQGLRSRLPAPEQPSRFGTSISQAIEEAAGKARTQAAEDYSAVKESLPATQPKIEASNLFDTATTLSVEESAGLQSLGDRRINSVLSEASRVQRSQVPPEIKSIYDNATESQKANLLRQYPDLAESSTSRPSYTWDDLQKTYQRLNSKISEAARNQDGNAVRVLSRLKESVSQDMANYAESVSPKIKDLFDDANARFAANQDILGTGSIGRLTSDLALETPESILGKIVGNEKASVINNIKKVVSPEKFQEVQSQYADRLMSPSKDVPFDPNHFIKQFDSINDETLKSVFGDDGFAELKKIDQLSKDSIRVGELQKTLDDYNSKAQTAQDAYQRARTAADQKRILDSSRNEAEAALESIKDEKFKRDIDKARSDLKKAQTPDRISFIVRALYGLISFGGFAVSGAPVAGIAAGLAAAALGRVINKGARSTAAQLTKALEKK